MPFISQRIKLPKELDRRLKLTDKQRKEVIQIYEKGVSLRGLAKIYRVDRKTIKNVVDFKAYRKQLQKYKDEQHWKKYYNTKKNTIKQKEYRDYKHDLYLKGLIKL